MLATLLASPKLIISAGIGLVVVCFVVYFFYSKSQIADLKTQLEAKTVQTQQDVITIKDLNDRLVLVQQLNQNFTSAVNQIESKQNATIQALNAFNLKVQAVKDPTGTAVFINKRINTIFHNLNTISGAAPAGKTK